MTRIQRLQEQIQQGGGFYITSRANIFYYSGFTSADASLLITKNRAVIITDSRYITQAKTEAPDFEFYNISRGLHGLLEGLEKIGYEEDYLSVSSFHELEMAAQETEFYAAGDIISKPRRVKEPEEIEKIRRAEELGDAAFSHVLKLMKPGISEREVAFEIETYMRKNGASGTSFETIVASGARSALPHATAGDKIIETGDFVTMDFGCVLDGYCSDMTRTLVIGKADNRHKEIYDAVLRAQEAALDLIKEGVLCSKVDAAARGVLKSAGLENYFLHSLGHSVGIEIHERPNFSPKSLDVVECGNVITVEPGVYIEGFGGVRIEDVVAITPKNVENLTKSAKELIII